MNVLVTGGVRSGKSRHAESLLADRPSVTYAAMGPSEVAEPDPDWVSRIQAHRARRPETWTTLETPDLARAMTTQGPVLIDCLGTWLTGLLDSERLWESDLDEIQGLVTSRLAAATDVLARRHDVVVVTNEVGLGVVPAHRSGRLFRDLLGWANQEVAAQCEEVHLVVAGRVMVL